MLWLILFFFVSLANILFFCEMRNEINVFLQKV